MNKIFSSFWFNVTSLLIAAFIMTRIFMMVIESTTFKWNDEGFQEKLKNKLEQNCKNLNLDTNGDGCYSYGKNREQFCLKTSSYKKIFNITSDTIFIEHSLNNGESSIYLLATSEVNLLLGYRTINTLSKEVESDVLAVGSIFHKQDKEVVEKEKRGIRWLQASLEAVKTYSRQTVLFNGKIQFFIYYFSMIIVSFIIIDSQFLSRNRKLLHKNTEFLDSKSATIQRDDLQQLLENTQENIAGSDFHPEIEPNIFSNIFKHALESTLAYESKINRGELLANIEAYGNGLQERIERRFLFVRYFLNTIPSLGFIGTVYGISEALKVTSKLTGESLTYERMLANEMLGQNLNVAFDTTLIGLVASIILSLFADWLENREMSFVIDARHKILNRFSLIQNIK